MIDVDAMNERRRQRNTYGSDHGDKLVSMLDTVKDPTLLNVFDAIDKLGEDNER